MFRRVTKHTHDSTNSQSLIENSRKELPKQQRGLRKRIEVVLSKFRHDSFRNNFRKCVICYLLLFLIVFFILILPDMSIVKYYGQEPYHMVQLVGEDYTKVVKVNRWMLELHRSSDQIKDKDRKKKKYKEHEKFESMACKAMHNWQLEAYPNCNIIHETNMKGVEFIAKGGFRDVWLMYELDGNKRVIKTLTGRKDFTHREYDRHRRDAVVTSLLTASERIPNIYGHCANSGVFDYTSSGTLEDHIKIQYNRRKTKWTRQEKLRISWQVSAALSDFHSAGMKEGFVPLSHTDIATDQFLLIDSIYKLNDFNRARYIRWDSHKNEPCQFYIRNNPGKNRSPEEYSYKYLTEKIDVYSLGNVIWSILNISPLFADIKSSEVAELVKKGETPPILQDSWQDEELAIIDVLKMCWKYDSKERASSKDVELFLRKKMKDFNITML